MRYVFEDPDTGLQIVVDERPELFQLESDGKPVILRGRKELFTITGQPVYVESLSPTGDIARVIVLNRVRELA